MKRGVLYLLWSWLIVVTTGSLLFAAPPESALQKRSPNAPLSVPAFNSIQETVQKNGTVKVIVRFSAPPNLPLGFQAEARIKEHGNVLAQQNAIKNAQDTIFARISPHNAGKAKRFSHIPFMAVEVDEYELLTLISSDEIDLIEEDVAVPPLLSQSVPLIGGDSNGSFNGYTGAGQTVAILDTGVDKTHSFLAGKVVNEACFSTTYSPQSATTVCPNGQASQTGVDAGVNCSSAVAGCNHGTHVAGIVAGNGSSMDGVAKGANLLAVQVFSRFDSASSCGTLGTPCALTYTSDQISALDWVYSQRNTYNIAAVNMSLGGGSYTTYCDSSNAAQKASIDNLRAAGIATVIASGNNGYTNAISAPACISSAISVGSTDKSDVVASYSNSASILNLLAPGSAINSSIPANSYASWNGTSMATPHVAGAWAVIKSSKPSATVDEVLNSLTTTGVTVTDNRNGISKPRINIASAISSTQPLPNTLGLTVNQTVANSCPFVNLYVTTTSDTELNNLTTANFSIQQDGSPKTASSVQYLGNTATSATAISFVMDYSGSMTGQPATDMATATNNFISSLGVGDVGQIVKFSTTFDAQAFTSDKTTLLNQIDSTWAGAWQSTYMYDALYRALQDTNSQSPSYRKAIVILTDGVSSTLTRTKADVVTLANSLGIPIFTIGIGSYLDSTTLMDLALQAGGSYFQAPTSTDIANIYQKISSIIKSQYLVKFSDTALDYTQHNVSLTVSVPGTNGTLTATDTATFTSCQGLFPVTVSLDPSAQSPQLAGTSVTFTAIGSGGTGSYNYEFYLQSPGSTTWTKTKAYSTSNSWTWNTTGLASGNYIVRVWAKSAGTSPTSGYDAYKNIYYTINGTNPTDVTITPNVSSPQTVGTIITFTAAASGGTGNYQYQFLLSKDSGTTWTYSTAYSDSNTWVWNTAGLPTGSNYRVGVWARSSTSTAAFEVTASAAYTLNPVPVPTVSISPSATSPQVTGTSITFTATGSSGSGSYDYQFLLSKDSGTTWTPVSNYSTANTWVWNTSGLPAGSNYRIGVWIRNAGSSASLEGSAAIAYTLSTNNPVVTLTPSAAAPQEVGTSITFTATGSGGSGSYEYQFLLSKDSGTTWTPVSNYSTANTWVWNTTGLTTGSNYRIGVWVRNAGSSASLEGSNSVTYTLNPVPKPTVTIAPSVASPQPLGTAITFTATGSGGSGSYEYQFLLSKDSGTTWTTVKAYSTSNIWTWNSAGLAAGSNYKVGVWIRSAGSGVSLDGSAAIPYTLSSNNPTVIIAPSAASPQVVGTSITFTATGSGGTGSYQYQFLLSKDSGATWTAVTAYSTSNTWVWNTAGLATGTNYKIGVWIRNAGSTATLEGATSIAYTINPVPNPTVSIASAVASPQVVGTAITFTATGSGGTGSYQYQFLLSKDSGTTWTTTTGYSSSNTWVWNTAGLPAGSNYKVGVWIRNTGSGASLEGAGAMTFTLSP